MHYHAIRTNNNNNETLGLKVGKNSQISNCYCRQ